jgi:general secretion pathway protein I
VRIDNGSKRTAAGGFTLIEVMVALFIFSVAVLVLLAARVQTVRMNEYTRETLLIVNLANMKLAEIVARGFVPPGVLTGRFGKPYRDFRWVEEVTASPLPIVRQVKLTVIHGREKGGRSFSLTTYVSNIP